MAQTRDERGGRIDVERSHALEREQSQQSKRGETMPVRRLRDFSLLDPFGMRALRGEMDRLFDNLGLRGGLLPSFGIEPITDLERSVWSPQIETYEKEGRMHICADLPGMNKNDVHVELKDDILMISGERKQEHHDLKGGWSERSYGNFFRSIPLPEGIDAESVTATFENGVLDIALEVPKRKESRGRAIIVK